MPWPLLLRTWPAPHPMKGLQRIVTMGTIQATPQRARLLIALSHSQVHGMPRQWTCQNHCLSLHLQALASVPEAWRCQNHSLSFHLQALASMSDAFRLFSASTNYSV